MTYQVALRVGLSSFSHTQCKQRLERLLHLYHLTLALRETGSGTECGGDLLLLVEAIPGSPLSLEENPF